MSKGYIPHHSCHCFEARMRCPMSQSLKKKIKSNMSASQSSFVHFQKACNRLPGRYASAFKQSEA